MPIISQCQSSNAAWKRVRQETAPCSVDDAAHHVLATGQTAERGRIERRHIGAQVGAKTSQDVRLGFTPCALEPDAAPPSGAPALDELAVDERAEMVLNPSRQSVALIRAPTRPGDLLSLHEPAGDFTVPMATLSDKAISS